MELEVQIDEKIYQEACLDLMVKTVLQDKQNERNTSSLYRRSLSQSNIAVYQINKELFLQTKPRDLKQEKQPTPKVIDEPLLEVTTYKTPEEDTHVRFLSVDNGKVFEKVLECCSVYFSTFPNIIRCAAQFLTTTTTSLRCLKKLDIVSLMCT